MQLTGSRGQETRDPVFDASGTITAGGTAQLVLPEAKQRTFLMFQNISDTNMYLEFGSARATATLTSGVVTSVAVTNAGFGFTIPPHIEFLGGGNDGWNMNNSTTITPGLPSWPSPKSVAQATCVLSGSTVGSIAIVSGGANYKNAPYVFIRNSLNDPSGCAIPSATVGVLIVPSGSITFNGISCPTDPMAVYCATTAKAFTCKYML